MATNSVIKDHHNLRRNLNLNDKYISNDGGNEGITIDNDGIITTSGTISLKEQSAAPTNTAGTGRLWVKDDNPTNLYFTDDTSTDIQLTSGGLLAVASAVKADDISTGDSAVNIGTSSGDIVFKSNASSGTAEWLTFNTTSTSFTEILGVSNNTLRLRSQGTQENLQLFSGQSVHIGHRIADENYGTDGSSIVSWKNGINFTDATCDYNDDPTIAHDDDNGKIHVDMRVEGNGIPDDAYVGVVSSDTSFELYKDGAAVSTTGGNLTNQTLAFTEGNYIRPTVFLGTLSAAWEANQTNVTTVQVLDQDHTDIPAQQRGSTSGSKVKMVISTDANGLPFTHASPYQAGYNYTQKFTDATCDYNHTTGLNADGSGGDSDLEDKSTIIHDDDDGAIKLFMSVTGTGIPIGAYVGEVVSDTCCRIHLGGGTGGINNLAREAVTTTATNGTLTFRDRVCFQDPGSTSSYMVLEVEEALDGTIDFGSSTETGLGQGRMDRGAYFDMNQSNFHLVADQRMKLMSDSMSNNVIQLDSDSVFLSGSSHTKKTGRGYTFVHAGDRFFVGNSQCNQVRMRLDGTDANRVFQITATDIPNGNVVTPGADAINSTAWDDAKGCRLVVGKTSGTTELKVDGAVGNFNIDAKGTVVIENDTSTADVSIQSQRDIELVPGIGTQTGVVTIDKNITSTTAGTYTGLSIDYDKTGTSTSNNTLHGLLIDADNTTATNGTNTMYGIYCTPTLSHASDAGTTNVYGAKFIATGASNGTSTATGLDIAVTGADTNYSIITSGGKAGFGVADPDADLEILGTGTQLKLSYDADSYATIAADSSSNTTIASAESGNIMLDAAGDIILDAGDANITLQRAGTTYTPAAASDAVTKAYADTNIYHFIRVGFNYGYTGGTKVYLPIPGAESLRESTSIVGASETICFLCPYDGSLEKIMIRSEEVCGSTVIGLHVGAGVFLEVPSATAQQTVTVDMAVDDTSYTFDFALAGSNTFTAGNFLAFSFDPTNDANDTHLMIVLKFDVSI